MLEQILESLDDDSIITLSGFDEAVIGVATDFTEPRLIYSVSKCLEIIRKDFLNNTTDDNECMEYLTFNYTGAYLGETTPIFCWDNFD